MVTQKRVIEVGQINHVFTKSIFKFKIFRNNNEFNRFRDLLKYYSNENPNLRFSDFLAAKRKLSYYEKQLNEKNRLIDIIAYCIMPTHVHLILKALKPDGISRFLNNVLNSYTRYFNTKIKRKGPLWQSRFKNIVVETDEQLLHLTRYVHLNPVTAFLVDIPEQWEYSSYNQYLGLSNEEEDICNFSDVFNKNELDYKKFVESNIEYQRELSEMKKLFIE